MQQAYEWGPTVVWLSADGSQADSATRSSIEADQSTVGGPPHALSVAPAHVVGNERIMAHAVESSGPPDLTKRNP